jgi:hypothetical protein
MIEELTGAKPIIRQVEVPPLPPALEAPAPDRPVVKPSEQQVQVADAVFSQEDETSSVLGLYGLMLGTPALLDHMAETFRNDDEEDEVKKKPKHKHC